MFSQWRQNVESFYFNVWTLSLSIYHVLMIMPRVLNIFAPYSQHNLQQFKYSKKSTVYIFLISVSTSCFCTVCTVHLVRLGWKCGWVRIRFVSMQAASIASNIKHNDVYHRDMLYLFIFIILYLEHHNQEGHQNRPNPKRPIPTRPNPTRLNRT
jgi:hypothetical protein